ncbi:MAG: cytochrome oxidase [bacterium]|nr:cytochrome oxidase [bacterium]
MTTILLLLFCSLVLVGGSILLFVFSARQGDCHEAERLCLMPLEDDEVTSPADAVSDSTQPNPLSSQERTTND